MAERLGDWLENLRAVVAVLTTPMRRMLNSLACLVLPAVRFVYCYNLCWRYHRVRFVLQPWKFETTSRYAVCKHISPVQIKFLLPLAWSHVGSVALLRGQTHRSPFNRSLGGAQVRSVNLKKRKILLSCGESIEPRLGQPAS